MFKSRARVHAVTKEAQMQVVMHEEMMDELQKQTSILEKLVPTTQAVTTKTTTTKAK